MCVVRICTRVGEAGEAAAQRRRPEVLGALAFPRPADASDGLGLPACVGCGVCLKGCVGQCGSMRWGSVVGMYVPFSVSMWGWFTCTGGRRTKPLDDELVEGVQRPRLGQVLQQGPKVLNVRK